MQRHSPGTGKGRPVGPPLPWIRAGVAGHIASMIPFSVGLGRIAASAFARSGK